MRESSPRRDAIVRLRLRLASIVPGAGHRYGFCQAFRRNQYIAQFHEVANLRPVDRVAVQPQTKPTPRPNVSRQIKTLWLAGSAIDVFPERRPAANRNDAVAVMIVQKISKYLAADAKIRMIARLAPLALRQRQTDFGQFLQGARFAHCSFGGCHQRLRLTNCKRLKRTADQSSSIATIRTDSKPALRMTRQPVSRLN